MMSSELDILIVGRNADRFAPEIRRAFRHWQVYNCDAPHALHGRRFRYAWVTGEAALHPNWNRMNSMLIAACEIVGGEVRNFRDYQPEVVDLQSFEDAALLRDIRRSRYAQ